jgi:putative ABC transport system permease protein
MISAAGAVLRGALAQNRAQAVVAVIAIALGVALGYAVQLINGTAINELALGVQTLSGDADLEVRGPRAGFDEGLFPAVARVEGVAVASPVVEVDAKLADRPDTLRIVGIDPFRAGWLQPGLVPAATERLDVLRSDALFPSAAAMRWLGATTGDRVRVQVALREVTLIVSGEVAGAARQRIAVMDIAAAQLAFERLGRLSRIDLRLAPGADIDAVRARVAALLPAGVAVARPAATLAASAGLSRSYRVNLNVLALVALFTGGLLVYSTQALAVVRRRAQFALLRVLGVTRRHLLALVVAESALIGAAGSAIGIVAGHALALVAVRYSGIDLGSGYFRGTAPSVAVDPLALAVFFVLGVAAAVLGAFLPALETARAAPAQALKPGDATRAFARLRPAWPALALLIAGALATALPPIAGLPLFGYLAIALLLIGTLLLIPRLTVLLLTLVRTPRSAPAQLAVAQLRAAPGQAAVSLATIVASVSLMVSMAIMVSSFRHSLDRWLGDILPADAYVRSSVAGDTAYMSGEVQQRLATLPGVARVEFLREQPLLLDPSRPQIALIARPIDSAGFASRLPLVGEQVAVAVDAPPPAWVNEAVVDLYGHAPGDVITLPLAGKAIRFTVAGVFRDYSHQQGAIVIDRDRYVALTGDSSVTNAALWLTPGASTDALPAALAREIPGGDKLRLALPPEIRAVSLTIFDRTFAVTYALELAAVAIGLVGLSSSFGALVLARRREFGVLRHIGMTRRQVGAMLAAEGVAVSAIGLVVGLVLGSVISLVLIHVVNRQSFHFGMDLVVPWAMLAGFALIVLALASATAVASGRGAMGAGVVRAVKEDW